MLTENERTRLDNLAKSKNVSDDYKYYEFESYADRCICIEAEGKSTAALRVIYDRVKDSAADSMVQYFFLMLFGSDLGNMSEDYAKSLVGTDLYKIGFDYVCRKLSTHKRNASGRISINDVNDDPSLMFLLSEGNSDSYASLNRLKETARGLNWGSSNSMNDDYMLILALDDMNIRGEQIKFCVEYVDGDFAKACKLIKSRDENIIAYVNKKVAEICKNDIPVNEHYVAVTGGASSTGSGFGISALSTVDLVMNPFSAEMFASAEVKSLVINYKSMDIIQYTSTEVAVKIAEAWGFNTLCKIPKQGMFGEKQYFIVMFNNKTGDFLESPAAEDDNFCNGGARAIIVRNSIKRAIFNGDEGIHGNSEEFNGKSSSLHAYECHYQEGIFNQYKYADVWDINQVPFEDYPLTGMVSLPYPEAYSEHALFGIDRKLPSELGYYLSVLYNEQHTVPQWANLMVAPKLIDEFIDEEHRKYFCAVTNNPYRAFAEAAYLNIKTATTIVELFRLAASLAGLSADSVDKYKQAICECLGTEVNKWEEHVKEDPRRRFDVDRCKGAKEKLAFVQNSDLRPTALERYVLSLCIKDIPAPDSSELPRDAIAWMRQFGPTEYTKMSDWGLFANMREMWSKHSTEVDDIYRKLADKYM